MYIEKINSPADLKKLSMEECTQLAEEIRSLILKRTSDIGGHVASNLGIVETAIAIHYVFDSPSDKVVFDVSHQSYAHKILTGRKEGFENPDKYSEISGYTNPGESEHDMFYVGHTSTSVSLACGLAKARDLVGGRENVIAVIGDGSLSGGEAFEGLDYAGGELKSNFIVIVNDNEMSIAENHGGIYNGLRMLKESNGTCENNYFKTLGFDYRFVSDGNDVAQVTEALRQVKDIDHPVIVHIATKKGKGYSFAEADEEAWHWRKPYNLETGELKNDFNGERYDRIIRDHLLERIKTDKRVIAMLAAVPDSLSFTPDMRKQAGSQFTDVGIAEEHAIAMAAGIAKNGGKPVFATLSTFFQRTYDQISQELCINKCPATLLVINASVYAVNDISHIGIFDIPLMSGIPDLIYLAPTNKQEYLAMLDWSIDQDSYPVAIRAPRNGVFYAKEDVDKEYGISPSYKIDKRGEKVAVLALGDFYQMGEEVVDKLKADKGIEATLVNPRYITGLDRNTLDELAKTHEVIITLEDGVLDGGFGQRVAGYMGRFKDVGVLNFGLKTEFLDRYNLKSVMEKNHLTPNLICEDIYKSL